MTPRTLGTMVGIAAALGLTLAAHAAQRFGAGLPGGLEPGCGRITSFSFDDDEVVGSHEVRGTIVLESCSKPIYVRVESSDPDIARIRSPLGTLARSVSFALAAGQTVVRYDVSTFPVDESTPLTVSAKPIVGGLNRKSSVARRLTIRPITEGLCEAAPVQTLGRPLDLDAECRRLHGPEAYATTLREDAYGWVCRKPGHDDHGIDMQRACRATYGRHAVATLVGIHAYDWRCLKPRDLRHRIVPVLLYPAEKLDVKEIPFVDAALRRIEALLGATRRFYERHSDRDLPGTNAFVLLTATSAQTWQSLAVKTDTGTATRYVYHDRVETELRRGGWLKLARRGAKLGAFVNLGSSFLHPSRAGAAADGSGVFFSAPPSNSYAFCNPSGPNPGRYENAFYATGHELGHTLGLPHTDEYGVSLPPDWRDSLMYTGQGTESTLFPFEVARLVDSLNAWLGG